MALEAKKDRKGRQGTIYVTEVSAQRGDIIKQITDEFSKDTELIEQSDFVLVANQKNQTKKPPREAD